MIYPFLAMDQAAAARFNDVTRASGNVLEPRRVENGPYKGKFVLPYRVRQDPAHASHYDAFAVLDEVQIDPEVAWPPTPEELAARAAEQE
jgi:hypothetical protein